VTSAVLGMPAHMVLPPQPGAWYAAALLLIEGCRRMGDAEKSQPGHAADRRRAALMAAAQAGDRTAYEALLRECVGLIQAIAYRQGVPADRVDDVVQETMLSIHRARQTYDPGRPFGGWLRAIAQRRAIDILRSAGRHGRREVHAPEAYESYADSAAPDQDLQRAQAGSALRPVIDALPPGQREAVQRLILEERSLTEAAAITGRKEGALKVNLHRALKTLRAKIGRAGE